MENLCRPKAGLFTAGLMLSVICACCIIAAMKEAAVPIQHPSVLLIAAILATLPLKNAFGSTLQKITVFYLVCIPISRLSSHYISISFAAVNINLPYSLTAIVLLAVGYLIERHGSNIQSRDYKEIFAGFVLSIVIVLFHFAILTGLLKSYYGYGYEHDAAVMGTIVSYLFLFILLFRKLELYGFRAAVSLILVGYLAIVMRG